MSTTLIEVCAFFEAAGVGVVAATLFRGNLPPSPDECMAVIPYPGRQPDFDLSTGGAIVEEYPRMQFLSRAGVNDEDVAMANAERAYRACAVVANRLLSGTRYTSITALQTPGILRRDQNDRPICSFNLELAKELSA